MTSKQRYAILLDWWPKTCRVQGWDPKDRDLRLRVIGAAIGREISSMNDLDNANDIDQVKAHLGRLADNVARTMETLPARPVTVSAGRDNAVTKPATAGLRRRYLWLIRKHAAALGGSDYALSLARDKFHTTAGVSTIEDLTTEQLHGLMITLAARAYARRSRDRNASLTSEECFPDQVGFAPEPEEADCPF